MKMQKRGSMETTMPKIPKKAELSKYPDRVLDNARIILAALPYVRSEGECPDCDPDVGFQCPQCGLASNASDLARYILYSKGTKDAEDS